MKKSSVDATVSNQQLEKELKRTVIKRKRRTAFLRTISTLLVLAAIFLIATVTWFPVYRITDNSMEPNLKQGQIVIALRKQNLKPGDIAAMYFENQILIKRVIGTAGDWIHMDEQGVVSVNDKPIDEKYLAGSAMGTTDLAFPYQVPDGCYFAMGDNRAMSIDSRVSKIGCIADEKVAGKIIFCVWPLQYAGYIE